MNNVDMMFVAVESLRKNTWNTNVVSAEFEQRIRNSISRNGMFRPIIVREVAGVEGYEIIGGEHRWEQAIELGFTKVPIANLGEIDDRRAKEIGVIDNARYGADDTLSFADLLKEIGDTDDLQEFLPYGSADLDAIFSSSNIALDDLDLSLTLNDEEEPEDEAPIEKVAKTHTIMRFKVPLGDGERVTALIASTQKTFDYTAEDNLTNAGDALVHLLAPQLPKSGDAIASLEDVLKEE